MDKKIQNLIDAAIAYAEIAERHLKHEEWKTEVLQEAANLARRGQMHEAKLLKSQVDSHSGVIVFDYTDVHKDLIKAVKPFRKKR